MKTRTLLSALAATAILGMAQGASAQWVPPYAAPPGWSIPGFNVPPAYGYGPPQPTYYAPPPPPVDPWRPEAQETRVGLAVDWFNSSVNGTTVNALAFEVAAQYRLADNFLLDASVPWAFAARSIETADQSFESANAIFGNPTVGAHFGARFAPKASFWVGLALGIPAVRKPDTADVKLTQQYAESLRGLRDAYRFLPEAFPILLRGGLELHAHPLFFKAELVPSILVAISSAYSTAFVIDQANDVGLRASFGLLGGLRLQETFIVTKADDHAQIAIEPFVGYESPSPPGLFARFGVLMPLDPPLGFAFDKGKLLTSRLAVGAKF